MQTSTKIKAYASHQEILKVLTALDAIKDCPPEDIKEWGNALKANIDLKINALLKWQEENKDLLELQKITQECLQNFSNKR